MNVFIVIACHFQDKDHLCRTTIARLERALVEARACKDSRFIVTGDVPYQNGTKTLGTLMKEYLAQHGVPLILRSRGGVGTYSEARIIMNEDVVGFSKEARITVISSDWHLWTGRSIWMKRARECGREVAFISLPHTGGVRVRCIYAVYAMIDKTASLLGLQWLAEKVITGSQLSRRQGFTLDGCR